MNKRERLTQLRALGFDNSTTARVECSQCSAMVINGVPCHERACPNAMHECHGCNELIPARVRYCEDCR